jgi:dinuclear metal center YbgI/SA1388 family protein
MIIQHLTDFLETRFPLSLQESYDNCGLTYGHKKNTIKGVLISLDVTEEIVQEAINKNCNLIVSHHPVIFKGLKKINGANMSERVLELCIKHEIALYAIHTNLDNHKEGVNKRISDKIGLVNTQILAPKKGTLVKLSVFVPEEDSKKLCNALYEAGAGAVGNYTECSFQSFGKGTYKPNENAKPAKGVIDKQSIEMETKVEFLVPLDRIRNVLHAMLHNHPYEEVAHDILPLLNEQQDMGSGMIGVLEKPMASKMFLDKLKETFEAGVVKHTALVHKEIKTVALCGGTGSFLIEQAKRKNADIFISSDIKYHEFFEANETLIIADIGHYESEQYTVNLIYENLKEKFSNFALHLTEVNTNPVKYI